MRVARFAEKFVSAYDFFDLEPTVLYRLAALPDEIAATLAPYNSRHFIPLSSRPSR